jgi:hypothetical protein
MRQVIQGHAMKRKLKWMAVMLFVFLVALGAALFLWPRDRITAASWKKIQVGMSVKEVEAILGNPGMNNEQFEAFYRGQRNKFGKDPFILGGNALVEPEDRRHLLHWVHEKDIIVWIGQRGTIQIESQQGRVKLKYFEELRSAQRDFVDRIRDWLGW